MKASNILLWVTLTAIAVFTLNSRASESEGKKIQAYDAKVLDQQPKLLKETEIVVPAALQGKSWEVKIDFFVLPDGSVARPSVASVVPKEFEPQLTEAAVKAVSERKYKPGRKGGRSVATHMRETLGPK